MKKIKLDAEKVAIFTDTHFGLSRDSVTKLNISEEFIDWFTDDLIKRKITDVIFMGDWFDNRNSINVNTLNKTYQIFKKLTDNFNLIVIIGNHDTYFRHSSDINSLSQFESLENITIIDKTTEIEFTNGRTALLCPWHFNPNRCKKQYDYMFGHFEFSGASLCGTTFQGGKYDMSKLTKMSPLVFSGHFHIRKEYPQKEGKVITAGCPYQLTWGDFNNDKGYYILETNTSKYNFVKNVVSPIHFKYYLTQLRNKTQSITKLDTKGNFVKLIVDDEYKYDEIIKYLDKINRYDPLKCEPEFTFSINSNLLSDFTIDKTELRMSNLQYILKFVEKMEDMEQDDKNELAKLAKEYYEICESS